MPLHPALFVFNSFHVTSLFLYPLKTSENLWFSDVLREYRKKYVTWNGLIYSSADFCNLWEERFPPIWNASKNVIPDSKLALVHPVFLPYLIWGNSWEELYHELFQNHLKNTTQVSILAPLHGYRLTTLLKMILFAVISVKTLYC